MESITNAVDMPLPNLVQAVKNGDAPALDQIKQVGEDFESVFLSMMLKEMRNSLDEGFFGSESSDSFGGMFDLFIGQHLAKTGPIGVGELLVQQYNAQQDNKVNVEDQESESSTRVSFSA